MSLELINKYNPIIYFHPDEKYFPVSMNFIIENSDLYENGNLIKKGPLTNRELYEVAQRNNFVKKNENIWIDFDNSLFIGEAPLKNVPVYVLVKQLEKTIQIFYMYYFAYNGSYSILGLEEAGQHKADLEHITVEIDKNTNEIIRVFYASHGNADGRWISKNDLQFENGRIVAFSALNGHGLYPKEGAVFRLGGLANDYLKKGIQWSPSVVQIYKRNEPQFNIDTMGFTVFPGRWGGKNGITNLVEKRFYNEGDLEEVNPPPIIDVKTFEILIHLKNLIILAILYFIMHSVHKFVFRSFNAKKQTVSIFLLTVIIIYILYILYKHVGMYIINKFVPS